MSADSARDVPLSQQLRQAELRCSLYRQSFLDLMQERFTEMDETLRRMLKLLATTLDVERVSFWEFNSARDAVCCRVLFRRDGGLDSSAKTVLQQAEYPTYFQAVSKEFAITAHDVMRDPRTAELTKPYLQPLQIGAMMDMPVRAFGRVIGVLCHEHIGGPRKWTLEDENFASAVATQVALAYERQVAREAQQSLMMRTLYDSVTGLPNEVLFEDLLAQCMARAEPCGVLYLRIDQYELLADSAGRQSSDAVVAGLARRLQQLVPLGSVLARVDHGVFGLLVERGPAELPGLAEHLCLGCADALEVNAHSVFLTISVGLTCFRGTESIAARSLMKEARQAMSEAEAAGGNRYSVFAPAMQQRTLKRLEIEQDLRRGMVEREFDLYFQPILDLTTGELLCVEALLRWQHRDRGLIPPAAFLQVAIECGVMLELGRRVLRAACESLKQLRDRVHMPSLSVSVNMSAPEILQSKFAETVFAELARAGLSPDCLSIEITETVLMVDLVGTREVIDQLRAGGVRIYLDDFGTAYSSLSWLRWLPLDKIKVDQLFVKGLPHDARDAAIVKAVAELARAFGYGVIAEGIENVDQLKAIRALGINKAQGFYFAKAEPVTQYSVEWLSSLRELVLRKQD